MNFKEWLWNELENAQIDSFDRFILNLTSDEAILWHIYPFGQEVICSWELNKEART